MGKIILQASPPADIYMPSPPLSILKAYLSKYGNCENDIVIVYWNILFDNIIKEFTFLDSLSERGFRENCLLLLNYLAIDKNDKSLFDEIKAILYAIAPKYLQIDPDFYEKHMYEYKKKMDELIDNTIIDFEFSECLYFGFTLKFDQNLFAGILSEKLKSKFPNIPIVVGGASCPESAIAILKNYAKFDIAIWGEGEDSLLKLTLALENDENGGFHSIDGVAFRNKDEIITANTNISNKVFYNLSTPDVYPDYSDYFKQCTIIKQKHRINLPVEFSRGCHWNKCHFCYLNIGYKYRKKEVNIIKNEILYMIEKHNIYSFFSLDNDIVGDSINDFNLFLDVLIEIKKANPQFVITNSEVITKNLTKNLIKKMLDAGIFFVQIGYESSSDMLLKKIEKKNSFASNLFFIKYALIYGLRMTQLNVITNLIEETPVDVLEAIENLKFLRFFRKNHFARHTLIYFCINGTSKYCYDNKKYNINKNDWHLMSPYYSLIKDSMDDDFKWYNLEYINHNQNMQWRTFKAIEEYYCNNIHTYRLLKSGEIVFYYENVNGRRIASYEFHVNSLEIQILTLINDYIYNFTELFTLINVNHKEPYNKFMIIEKLNFLVKTGIIYCSQDMTEIVSVINMDTLRDISTIEEQM